MKLTQSSQIVNSENNIKAPEIWGRALRMKIFIITPIEEVPKDISIKTHFKTIETANVHLMETPMRNIKNGELKMLKIIKHIIRIPLIGGIKTFKILIETINNFIKVKEPIEKGSNKSKQDTNRLKEILWRKTFLTIKPLFVDL